MSNKTKKNAIAITALMVSVIGTIFAVLGVQRANADTEKNDAVAYATVDTTAKVMLDDHARRLTGHDAMFLENSEERKKFSDQLSIYSQTQNTIKQAQLSLKETQARMEDSAVTFQKEMRGDIKELIKETSKANAWINKIESE